MAANLSEIRAAAGAIGGRYPASELQKQIASQTARNCKPWTSSTGAKSELGKFITARNSSPKPGPLPLNRMIDSRTEPDFEAECQRVELLLELITKTCEDITALGNGLGTYTSADMKSSKLKREFSCGTQVAVYRCQVSPVWRYSDILSDIYNLPERYCLEQTAKVKLRYNEKKEQLIKLIALAQTPQSPGQGLVQMLAVVAGLELSDKFTQAGKPATS